MEIKNLRRFAAFSAFYLAFAYLIGIIIFFFVLDYPNIVEPSQKINLLLSQSDMMYITNLLMYVIFGL
ncbi:MAG TPA: hypothetical protein VEC16_01195, partial [Alphaproteobacteria bacterium]|nr:hypothetical protein [Alphaproteobacteria bacterium]